IAFLHEICTTFTVTPPTLGQFHKVIVYYQVSFFGISRKNVRRIYNSHCFSFSSFSFGNHVSERFQQKKTPDSHHRPAFPFSCKHTYFVFCPLYPLCCSSRQCDGVT